MKGTILNVDPASLGGVLRAEDGRRYDFAGAEWKSPKPPAVGDQVDFEPVGQAATALYAIKSGAPPIDLSGLKSALASASETAAKSNVGAALLADWRPMLAALSLIACLFPYASLGPQSASLLTVVSHMGDAIDALNMVRGMGGRGGPDFAGLAMALRLTYLLWLIPITAVAVLFCTFTGRPNQKVALIHGAACVVTPIFVAVVVGIAVASSIPPEFRRLAGRNLFDVGLFGLGAWLIVGLGAAQLAQHFGYLKKTPRELIKRA